MVFAHTTMFPEIAVGCVGIGLTVTAITCAVPLPQELFAVTLIFPLTPALVLMLSPVDVPDQPLGMVHVYDVAPATAVMLYV